MKKDCGLKKIAFAWVLSLAVLALAGGKAFSGEPVRIAAVGDIMTGNTFPEPFLPPDDGKGLFDRVKSAWDGCDLVFGNLEGAMIDGGTSTKCPEGSTNCYAFRMPTRYAARLAEGGFTALGVVNNHASDFGAQGRASTVKSIAAAGIKPVGGLETAVFEVRGKKVAIAGFAYPMASMAGSRYFASITDIPAAKKAVARLAAENDIVMVSFHGGAEGSGARHVTGKPEIFLGEDRGDVTAFAHAVIDAGADLVVGHGPHVLRAAELYKGRLIAYSMGNFATYGGFNLKGPNGISAVLTVDLDPETGAFLSGRIVSTKQIDRGLPRMDPENTGAAMIRELTADDFPSTGLSIKDDGTMGIKK